MWPQFLAQIDWGEPLTDGLPASALQVNVNDSYQLQSVAQQLQGTIHAQPLPQRWRSPLEQYLAELQASTLVFRPSLTVEGMAMPPPKGLLRSQLTLANLEAAVGGMKAAWAQLFAASSLFYWRKIGVCLTQVKLALVIQPLLPAVASGDLEIKDSRLTLRSVQGLGHALALGEALPECHHVDFKQSAQTGQAAQTQDSAAQQTHAYWLGSSDSPKAEAPGLLIGVPPTLQYRQCLQPSILSPTQRQQLVTLGRSVAEHWSHKPTAATQIKLDWIICDRPHQDSSVYLTQLTAPAQPATVEQTEPSGPPCPSIEHKAALPVNQRLAAPPASLTGLGASPGQVRGRIYRVHSPRDWIPPNAILLAVDVTIDWMPLLQQSAGVVTEQGGMTSHAAILTRGLGIPAVVGVTNATQLLQDGDIVVLDGDRGSVVQFPPSGSPSAISSAENTSKHRHALLHLARRTPFKPKAANTLEYRIRPIGSFCSLSPSQKTSRTKLMLTLSHIDQLYSVTNIPIDGIGLLRSELLLLPLLEQRHPLHWLSTGNRASLVARIAARISQIAAAVFPDPVFYRSLDLCTDEYSYLEGAPQPHERNPALGQHGTYSYSLYPELFETELAALRQVQQAGYSNLRLVLPFVRSVKEVTYAQEMIVRAQLNQVGSFQLWIMAEVPSVLLLLPEYVQAGVQGIAVGSNDLAQLLFAADRSQPDISSRFHTHPALLRAIKQLVEQAAQLGIASAICGDLPSQHPQTIASLVEWGIGAISVPAEAAATAWEAIAEAELRLSSRSDRASRLPDRER